MAIAAPLHEAEKVAEQQDEKPSVAPAEQTEEKKIAEDVAPEQQAAVPAPSSDEKIPVEPQLAPYPPSSAALSPTLSPALSSASPVPGSPFTATATTPPPPLSTISSTDTDKVAVTPVMGQYPTDPSQQPPAPIYPDHTGSTSPHQQYTIQPDHAYHQQPPYDHNQYYAQQQQQQQQQQQHPGAQQYRTATPIANLNRSPAPVDCPACGHRALTATSFQTGNTTHAWAFGVCLCLCLGCIPYLMSSTKDVQHKCGKCGVLLATWHRSGNTDVHMHA